MVHDALPSATAFRNLESLELLEVISFVCPINVLEEDTMGWPRTPQPDITTHRVWHIYPRLQHLHHRCKSTGLTSISRRLSNWAEKARSAVGQVVLVRRPGDVGRWKKRIIRWSPSEGFRTGVLGSRNLSSRRGTTRIIRTHNDSKKIDCFFNKRIE